MKNLPKCNCEKRRCPLHEPKWPLFFDEPSGRIIKAKWPKSHFSYSQWRVWKCEGPKSYAMKYIYFLTDETNPRMTLGKQVHEMIESDTPHEDPVMEHLRVFLPQYPLKEFNLEAQFNGIKLVGKPDGLDLDNKIVGEYKTASGGWNKAMADCVAPMSQYYKNGAQLTWYALLLHLNYGWKPEDIRFELTSIPTVWEEGEMPKPTGHIETFETRRTMRDMLNMGKDIVETWKEVGIFCGKEMAAIGK